MHGGITECEHEKRALGVEPMGNSLFRLALFTLFQGQQRLPLVWCWYQCETAELAPWYQDPAPQSWHKGHLSSTVCCPPNPPQCHLQIESTAKIRLTGVALISGFIMLQHLQIIFGPSKGGPVVKYASWLAGKLFTNRQQAGL